MPAMRGHFCIKIPRLLFPPQSGDFMSLNLFCLKTGARIGFVSFERLFRNVLRFGRSRRRGREDVGAELPGLHLENEIVVIEIRNVRFLHS